MQVAFKIKALEHVLANENEHVQTAKEVAHQLHGLTPFISRHNLIVATKIDQKTPTRPAT